jgi:hypothetical protein
MSEGAWLFAGGFVVSFAWTLLMFFAGADAGRQAEANRWRRDGCPECRRAWWAKHYGPGAAP